MVENGSSGGSSGPCSMGDDSHPYTPFMLWHAATPVLDPGPRGHRQQRQSPTQPHPHQWGGGGVQDPPPLVPRCRLFNIGPKIGPPSAPPPFLLVDLIWTPPPFKNPGSAPAYPAIPHALVWNNSWPKLDYY